jgi:RimJ/RimL family protein N-acetyltransferase
MGIPIDMRTRRLRLYAPSRAEVEALRHGVQGVRDELGGRLQAVVSDEWWLGPSLLRLLSDLPEVMRCEPDDMRWIWIVIDPAAACVIGDIGFHTPIHASSTVEAEIGWSVIPAARGKGYTPEAVAALLTSTFAQTHVQRIIAQIEPTNTASLRVAAKLGMEALPPRDAKYLCFGVGRSDAVPSAAPDDE